MSAYTKKSRARVQILKVRTPHVTKGAHKGGADKKHKDGSGARVIGNRRGSSR